MSEEAMEVEEEVIEDIEVDGNAPSGEAGVEAPADPPAEDDGSDIRAEMEDLRRRTEAAEARADASQNVVTQQITYQDRVRQEQAQREALEAMTPAERLQYQSEIEKNELRQIADSTRAELADSRDQSEYNRMAMEDSNRGKVAREHSEEVEKRLKAAHNAGYNHVKRATILKDLLGEKLLEGASKGTTRQVEQAQGTVKKSTSSPAVNGGDVSDETNTLDSVEADRAARDERLANRHTAY